MFKPEYITRHLDLVSEKQLSTNITVVGAGAIGSFTVLALAKMGFYNITVVDFDTVEPENIGAQFFPTSAIGKYKAEALQQMVFDFTGIKINAVNQKVADMEQFPCDMIISAVDNMAVRKMIYDTAYARYIIDPRMAAEYATMNVVDLSVKSMRDSYEKTLFSDSEAVQERCTAKTTIYTVLLIAGQIVKAVKDVTSEQEFIKSLDWNISKNAMLAFSSQGGKL
jgi:molybdopterin/thiamine biosynthesis adenylyltransferase